MSDVSFADEMYRQLSLPLPHRGPPFDVSTLRDLPPPAQRLLRRTLPGAIELRTVVQLDLVGQIKLGGRWFDFTANQLLSAGKGFVWQPTVRGRLLKMTGADVFGPSGARVDFRLLGRVPLVRSSGPGVDRSAAGRLAAETVAWVPQALTPQLGAHWQAVDDHTAAVTLDAAGRHITVEVDVADDGRLRSLSLDRWKESAKPPQPIRFGAAIKTEHTAPGGVLIAGSGTVGWHWHTAGEADGHFYRFRVARAAFVNPARPPESPSRHEK